MSLPTVDELIQVAHEHGVRITKMTYLIDSFEDEPAIACAIGVRAIHVYQSIARAEKEKDEWSGTDWNKRALLLEMTPSETIGLEAGFERGSLEDNDVEFEWAHANEWAKKNGFVPVHDEFVAAYNVGYQLSEYVIAREEEENDAANG